MTIQELPERREKPSQDTEQRPPMEEPNQPQRPVQTPSTTRALMRPFVSVVRWLDSVRRIPTALVGLIIIGVFVLLAFIGPAIAPYTHTEFHLADTLQPPSATYWFGTDQFGRDIFSRVLVGSRNILVLATSATGLGLLLGIAVGLSAGYFGGRLDEVLMRAMDVMMSFPSLLLALLILSTLGPALINVVLAIAVVFMPRVARVVRSVVLDLKTKEFVDAARVRGESAFYIMTQEILPNAMGPIIVEASIRISYAILLGASLGFLGLGVQPPAPDWGLQVSEGRNFIQAASWVVLFPALAIALLVIGVNLFADGLGQMMHLSAGASPVNIVAAEEASTSADDAEPEPEAP